MAGWLASCVQFGFLGGDEEGVTVHTYIHTKLKVHVATKPTNIIFQWIACVAAAATNKEFNVESLMNKEAFYFGRVHTRRQVI